MKTPLLTEAQTKRVTELILKRAQNLLASMADESRTNPRYGNSPLTWLVARRDGKADHGMVTGNVVEAWLVSCDSITPLSAPTSYDPGERSGMYYSRGNASFFIHPTEPLLWFGFQVGPRYGRGHRIQLGFSDLGQVYFAEEKNTWIS